MAVAQERTTNGFDLFPQSQDLFAEILFNFRECHDLCVNSGLFTNDVILQIDQCAVDFRQMSIDTVAIAKRMSVVWLDTAIMIFENIDDIDDPKEVLSVLGTEAGELAKCFHVVAALARDIAARFHHAQGGTIKEAEEFKKSFEKAQESASNVKQQLEKHHAKVQYLHWEAESRQESWEIARIALAWLPPAFITTTIGCKFSEMRRVDAQDIERRAAEKLRKSEEELRKKTAENEKAKVKSALIVL